MAAKSGGPLLTVRIIAPREILYGSKPAMCLLFSSKIGFIGNNIAQKMQNRTDIIMSKQALAKLDRTDLRILEALQHNGGLTNQQLAETVGLSPSPCSRRVQKLEAAGIILKRETVLDARKLGLDLTVIIQISMDRHTPERFANFEEKVASYPEVQQCYLVTGQEADYLLKVVVPDIDGYQHFLLNKITRIEGVSGVHSSFVMRRVVDTAALPLNYVES